MQHQEAEILADLLQGNWLQTNTQISVRILEQRDQIPNRRADTERALIPINSTVTQQPLRDRQHFDHGRSIEIYRCDGKHFRILLDKGMSFLKKKTSSVYEVTSSTYIVVSVQNRDRL